MFNEDDRVSTGEVESETADVSRQEETIDGRVRVEGLHDRMPLRDIR